MSKWYNKGVFYHIYPLGLLGAPEKNEGGDPVNRLCELEEWIPHMKRIGITATYIGPLFESVGHGYETTDYKLVDRRLGDNEAFTHFVKKCHAAGIKVVVDGVFNHTGREFFAFLDLKRNRENSRYNGWYNNVNFGANNEYNDGFSYEAWRGYNILVKLNQKNPEVKNYIFEVIKYWVDNFDIDGIRLDCADVLDFDFMREMRSFCNGVKEDFWLMGEVIHGDYGRWVGDQMLHSVTNYELHKGLYSGHNDHNYFEIAHTIRRLFDGNGGMCKGATLYTFADNHDVERLTSKLSNKDHVYPIYQLIYTLPGIPSIYYGSEFGLEGKKDNGSDKPLRPELNLCDFLSSQISNLDKSLENIEGCYKDKYQKLIKLLATLGNLKAEYRELTDGVYRELTLTNRQYSFARILENSAIISAVNNNESEARISISLPVKAEKIVDLFTGEELKEENGKINILIPPSFGKVIWIGEANREIKQTIPNMKISDKKQDKVITAGLESKYEVACFDQTMISFLPHIQEPFKVIGRLIPQYREGNFSYSEEIFNDSFDKLYPDHKFNPEEYINNSEKVAFLAMLDGNCVGSLCVSKDWNHNARIDDIAIDVAHRRKGIGTMLMDAAVKWSKEKGLKGISLETQDNNLLACRFYFKYGFQIGGIDKLVYNSVKGYEGEIALYFYLLLS